MLTDVTAFQQNFELAPILFKGGIAEYFPGQIAPITSFTEPGGFGGLSYTDYFAHFKVMSGGTIIEYQFAEYPFASLQVAVNAVIQMPLKVSLMMICPAQNSATNNYNTKLNTLTLLQQNIQQHIQQGGYFTVLTPSFVYEDVLLKTLRDITPVSDKQVQALWQWDFEQPLIALPDANTNVTSLVNSIGTGQVTTNVTSWNSTGSAG